jgi:hypothetical protein
MTDSRSSRLKAIEHRYRDKVSELVGPQAGQVGVIAEAFGQVVQDLLKIEDQGWTVLSKAKLDQGKGIALADAKSVTQYLEQQTKTLGGLLGRGLRLKNNHLFGRGYQFKAMHGQPTKSWITNLIEDEDNWAQVFSPTALKELNRILFTSGNLFIVYDSAKKTLERLAIDINIDNALCYPDDLGRIKYVLRKLTVKNDIVGSDLVSYEWIPTLAYADRLKKEKTRRPKTLVAIVGGEEKAVPVNQTSVIIEKRINRDNGETWGIPDGFPAAPWAVLYSTYLRDGAKLQGALAAISYLVKAKTELAAKTAGAKISSGRVGQAAIAGPETSIEAMPRSGAVDLYEGRPLQAQCAASLDVSVTGLAADPGLGGSYASENALSQPEQLAALSRQEDFTDLFRQIFAAMEAKNMLIDFRRLDVDPIHRTMQSLNLARERGGISQLEYRKRVTELLDIDLLSEDLPKPDEWVKGAGMPSTSADPGSGGDSTPDTGVSGTVGSLDDSGNAARDDDAAAGTA